MLTNLVDRAYEDLWGLRPDTAVYLGRHEYDGVVPDLSVETVDRRLDRLRSVAAEASELSGLEPEPELDRDLLVAEIERVDFEWTELREPQRNPMDWIYRLEPDVYLKRRYAEPSVRAAAVATLLRSSPAVLATARARLDGVLPRVACEWGVRAGKGLAQLIDEDVRAAFPDLPAGDAADLDRAATEAVDELASFVGWLERERLPLSDDSYPIGPNRLERLLEVSEMVTHSVDELRAIAEEDLERNLGTFREVAASIDPDLTPREVYDRHVASVHPDRDELVETTELMLEEIRDHVIDRDLVTVPSEVRAIVAPTPPHLRWAFAMMDTPGPYERVATEAYYYVTPVDPSWSDEQAEEWLRALNTYALEDISIHEAYPGHYVHFLHYQHAPTEVSRRVTSYAFSEGWAHYTEQMMWEEGFRAGDPRFHLAQLAEALVRNCRFVCALELHAGAMTVDEATAFFEANAYYEETPARQEAERGTFDPGYFSYTLGKLQILQLRADYLAGTGASLKQFHDALLRRGAPPVEILRRSLLG